MAEAKDKQGRPLVEQKGGSILKGERVISRCNYGAAVQFTWTLQVPPALKIKIGGYLILPLVAFALLLTFLFSFHLIFLLHSFVYFILFEKLRDKQNPSIDSFASLNACNSHVRLKPDSIRASHVGGGDLCAQAITCCLPGCRFTGSWHAKQIRDSNQTL